MSFDPKWTKPGGHVLLKWKVGEKDVPLLRAGFDPRLEVWWAALEAEREETVNGQAGVFRGVVSQGKKGEGIEHVLAHVIVGLASRARLKPWAEVAAPNVCGGCGQTATDLEPRRRRFVPGILTPPGEAERRKPDELVWLCGACRKGPVDE
jgi:hypothetical protein